MINQQGRSSNPIFFVLNIWLLLSGPYRPSLDPSANDSPMSNKCCNARVVRSSFLLVHSSFVDGETAHSSWWSLHSPGLLLSEDPFLDPQNFRSGSATTITTIPLGWSSRGGKLEGALTSLAKCLEGKAFLQGDQPGLLDCTLAEAAKVVVGFVLLKCCKDRTCVKMLGLPCWEYRGVTWCNSVTMFFCFLSSVVPSLDLAFSPVPQMVIWFRKNLVPTDRQPKGKIESPDTGCHTFNESQKNCCQLSNLGQI